MCRASRVHTTGRRVRGAPQAAEKNLLARFAAKGWLPVAADDAAGAVGPRWMPCCRTVSARWPACSVTRARATRTATFFSDNMSKWLRGLRRPRGRRHQPAVQAAVLFPHRLTASCGPPDAKLLSTSSWARPTCGQRTEVATLPPSRATPAHLRVTKPAEAGHQRARARDGSTNNPPSTMLTLDDVDWNKIRRTKHRHPVPRPLQVSSAWSSATSRDCRTTPPTEQRGAHCPRDVTTTPPPRRPGQVSASSTTAVLGQPVTWSPAGHGGLGYRAHLTSGSS